MRRPVCLFGLAFVILILCYLHFRPVPAASFEELDKSTVELTGLVEKKEYRISEERKSLVIYLKEVQIGNQSLSQEQKMELNGVLCYMKEGQEPKTGSAVRIRGTFGSFSRATNPGEFDSQNYYRILNLQARVTNGTLLKESVRYDRFRETLHQLRQYLSGRIDLCFHKNDASVMKAMLLGEKEGLDADIKQLYQKNGIIHILSISGLHISVIGMGLYRLLERLRCPKPVCILLSVGIMYSYGVMTGGGVSAQRAVAMFGFHMAAKLLHRTYDMLTAMTVVGISILLRQPLYLYHSGFLFSFGAILAIGLFAPVFEKNLFGGTKAEKMMVTGFSISLITLPVYLCFYYEYPPYSMLLNLFAIPGAGFLVSGGLLSLAGAVFCPPLGTAAALPVHLLLAGYEFCCKAALWLPGNSWISGRPGNWQLALFALILTGVLLCADRWSRLQFWQWILLALLCLTMRFHDKLQITALDVGQGDCIYLADEKGGRYLIDGGSSSKSDVGTYQMLPFLKEEGADTLDAVFVTHMDSDHYSGIYEMIKQIHINGVAIKNLVLPDLGAKSREGTYEELEALAKEQDIALRYLKKGDTLRHGKLRLTCLHPERGAEQESNAASVVLYLEYGNFTALFTGDLEGSGEEKVRSLLEGSSGEEMRSLLEGSGGEEMQGLPQGSGEEEVRSLLEGSGGEEMRSLPQGSGGERMQGLPEERESERTGVTVLKVAHHGSKYSTKESFLEIVSPKIALISAGRDNSYGHPHAELLERLERCGSGVYITFETGAVTIYTDGTRVWLEQFLERP